MEPIPLRNPFPGAACFYLQETTSTMDEARRYARLGFPQGTFIGADQQSMGRGRFPERAWQAEKGKSLLGTIILGPGVARIPGFPLRIGLAVCRAVDIFLIQGGFVGAEDPRLKWPNDVFIKGRKIAGILCEASPEATYAGFGVNVNQRNFPPELEAKATSLALQGPGGDDARELDRFHLLELVLDQIFLVLSESSWREEAEALLWRRGETVRFLNGLPERQELIEGRLLGLDPQGALLIAPSAGGAALALVSGELLAAEVKPASPARVDRNGPNHIR